MAKKVKDVMTREVVFLLLDDTVRKAAEHMKDLNVGVMPVCTPDRHLLGLITDRDIVTRVVATGASLDQPLRNCVTLNPVTVRPDEDVKDAARAMQDRQIRRLPVVDDGMLVGIVSLGDIAVKKGDDDLSGETLETISRPATPNEEAIKRNDHVA